jgi:hypothetical protein
MNAPSDSIVVIDDMEAMRFGEIYNYGDNARLTERGKRVACRLYGHSLWVDEAYFVIDDVKTSDVPPRWRTTLIRLCARSHSFMLESLMSELAPVYFWHVKQTDITRSRSSRKAFQRQNARMSMKWGLS